MRRILRPLLLSLFALLIYFIALPWLALQLDQRMKLVWRLPFWTETAAAILVLVGFALLLKCGWTWIFQDSHAVDSPGTSTTPDGAVTIEGWVNAALLGSWLCGLGIAMAVRSPSFVCVAVVVTIVALLPATQKWRRQVAATSSYLSLPFPRRIPRWAAFIVVIASASMCASDLSVDMPTSALPSEPAILVQVRCKPGTSYLWKADFDKHIRPAIEEVIARGGAFTGLQVIQATLPWQPFDFMLLYTGKSFGTLDKPSVPPHFAALFQREGTVRALAVLKEMNSYEDQSTVTIVYLSKVK